MKNLFGVMTLALIGVTNLSLLLAADGPPGWAYGFPPGAAGLRLLRLFQRRRPRRILA